MNKCISFKESLIAIVLCILTLIVNLVLFKKPVYYGIIGDILIVSFIGILNGYSIEELFVMAYKGLRKSIKVIVILSLVGLLIGIWKINGVIPTMIYYGFRIINPKVYVLSVFIICCIISMILGTAVGTVSTIGIVLIGIGSGLNIPVEIVAGAIVSGAFMGDRSSPLSSVLNLTSTVTETDASSNVKYFFTTLIPGIILAMSYYYFIGLNFNSAYMDKTSLNQYMYILVEFFNITPWLIALPILVIVLAFIKVPTVYNMAIGVAAGSIFSIIFQGSSLIEVIKAALLGYYTDIPAPYSSFLCGGGLYSFRVMLIVLMCATSLNGIFEGTGIIENVIKPALVKVDSDKKLLLFTAFFSITTALFVCNQILSVIIPSGLLLKKYREKGIEERLLARTLADSGVAVSFLIPWNVAALTTSYIMGVAVINFLPYTALCYIMPIITTGVIMINNNAKNKYFEESIR